MLSNVSGANRRSDRANATAGTFCGTGRCNTAAARIGASNSTGAPAASVASSFRVEALAVSAARSSNGVSPVSSTGVPRRSSAIARWTPRTRRTEASGPEGA